MHDSSPGLSFLEHLNQQVARGLETLLTQGEDETALHDRRVSSRRLRALAALLSPWVDSEDVRKTAHRLKALTQAFGPLREWDVHRVLLRQLRGEAVPDLERAALEHADSLAERARRKTAKKVAAIAPPKVVKGAGKAIETLVQAFHAGFDGGICGGAWTYLQPRVQAGFGPLHQLMDQEDAEAMHHARTALKELRYGLEWLGPAFHGDLSMWLSQIKALQDAIGLHHDWVVLSIWLEDVRVSLAAEGRSALASGLAQVRSSVQAHREEAYRHFQSQVPSMTMNALAQDLWMSLGPWEG